MVTSDERRELAARLRREGRALTAIDMGAEIASLTLDDAIGIEHNATWEECFNRLADLIDPEEEGTCHDVSDDESVFKCSRCGCALRLWAAKADAFENVTYGPTLTMPNGRGFELSFCPHCRARVVSGNGEED